MIIKVRGKKYRWDLWECFANLAVLVGVVGAIASTYFAFIYCR